MKKIIAYILIAALFTQQVGADWSVESQELIKKIDSQSLNKDQLTQIMDLANEHEDMNLLMSAFKKLKPDVQKTLVSWYVAGVFSLSSKSEKGYESSKQKVKMLSTGLDINYDVYYHALSDIKYQQRNIQKPLEFFISLGFPVNYIPADTETKETLLDTVNNALSQNDYKDNKDLIATREYLISKGAKTYAELQSK